MPFDPEQLTPEASINRVRVVELPGVELPDEIRGKQAFDYCSQAAFVREIRDRAPELGIDAGLADTALPRLVAERLESPDEAIRSAAKELCAGYGRRLGFVLAALKRGDKANRLAREEWDESYWRHWGGLRRIWLGGGLSSGALGRVFRAQASQVLLEAGVADCELLLHEQPAFLPLLGAARAFAGEAPAALVLDFGQTRLKSGVARYGDGRLRRLDVLPSQPSVVGEPDVAEAMAVLMSRLWVEQVQVDDGLAGELQVCVASYIRDNHPYNYSLSAYADLHRMTDNLGGWLSARVSELAGREVWVNLLHDGTAAGNAFAGEANTAVVMLGTAMGAGFPSMKRVAVPSTPGFEIGGALG